MTYKSKMPILLAFVALCVIGATSLCAYRIGSVRGYKAGYAIGYTAPHPVAPVALIELNNCAGAIGFIAVDSAGKVYWTGERYFDEDSDEAPYLTKLADATGGVAHIRVTEGCT